MREKCSETVVGLDLMLVLSTARLGSLNLSLRCRLVSPIYCKLQKLHYTLNVRSRGKQLVLFSRDVLMFPETKSTRLSLQQQQKNNRSGPKQSTRYL